MTLTPEERTKMLRDYAGQALPGLVAANQNVATRLITERKPEAYDAVAKAAWKLARHMVDVHEKELAAELVAEGAAEVRKMLKNP